MKRIVEYILMVPILFGVSCAGIKPVANDAADRGERLEQRVQTDGEEKQGEDLFNRLIQDIQRWYGEVVNGTYRLFISNSDVGPENYDRLLSYEKRGRELCGGNNFTEHYTPIFDELRKIIEEIRFGRYEPQDIFSQKPPPEKMWKKGYVVIAFYREPTLERVGYDVLARIIGRSDITYIMVDMESPEIRKWVQGLLEPYTLGEGIIYLRDSKRLDPPGIGKLGLHSILSEMRRTNKVFPCRER